MQILKITLVCLCALWALGGAIVMSGYGAGDNAAEITLSALTNFGPVVLSFIWLVASRRKPKPPR